MDSAVVAERTGAQLVGGTSTANIGRGHGLAEHRLTVVTPGVPTTYGDFTLTHVESSHCPPDRYPGTITEPVRTPARAAAYKSGEAWLIIVAHQSGPSVLVQGGSDERRVGNERVSTWESRSTRSKYKKKIRKK